MRPFPEKVYCEPFWNVKGQGQKWTTGGISIFHFTVPTIDRLGSHSQMSQIRQFFQPEKVPFPSFRSRTSKNLEKIPTPQLAACSYDNCEFTQRLWPVEWSWCPGHKSINSPDKFHSNKLKPATTKIELMFLMYSNLGFWMEKESFHGKGMESHGANDDVSEELAEPVTLLS